MASASASGRPHARGIGDGDRRAPEVKPPEAEEAIIIDAQIRAERMAVRLKLQSVGGKASSMSRASASSRGAVPSPGSHAAGSDGSTGGSKTGNGGSSSLDAAIKATTASGLTAGSASSTRIDEERAAVRTRLEKFSINRYAFVNAGANAGRVIDRVTGEAAPVTDDATRSLQDRVHLAQERVKQAQQEVENARTLMELKQKHLGEREEKLQRLGEALAQARKEEEEAESIKVEERRLTRARLSALEQGVPQPGAMKPGYSAPKQATLSSAAASTSSPSPSSPETPSRSDVSKGDSGSSGGSENGDAALTRAQEAIRNRASSSVSRLRRQHRIKRAGRAKRSASESSLRTALASESTTREYDPLGDKAAANGAMGDAVTVTASKPATTTNSSGDNAPAASSVLPKPIFVISDCTGESAANTCRAALGQFEETMNLSMPTNLYIFRFLSEGSDVYKIVQQAAEDDALVVYTLADAAMATAVKTACKLYSVNSVNLWGPLLESMEEHLDVNRTGVPMVSRSSHVSSDSLSNDYFRMIEAVEFTRQMDDGARPNMWREADILILGVSRTGKTPLSIYLGQRGYKVANLPLVPRDGQLMVPKYIDDVDPKRVFGLLINGEVLHSIRTNRLSSIGVSREDKSAMEYGAMRQVTQELSLAKALYARHPEWTVLDVTHKGVEETAARIMKIIYEDENANNYSVMKAT